jgi:hypothetical protein
MVDAAELELLRASALNCGGDGRMVTVIVNSCAYSCCGRGWLRREGYEQTYRGWIDNLHDPDKIHVGTFMLYAPGIGTLGYTIAVRFDEVELVR